VEKIKTVAVLIMHVVL